MEQAQYHNQGIYGSLHGAKVMQLTCSGFCIQILHIEYAVCGGQHHLKFSQNLTI